MDLLTQGLIGGTLALAAAKPADARIAAPIGFAAGLLADTDILIRSSDDPLLNVEFHRHFSHALIFIPVGALIAAIVLWPLLRRRIAFGRLYWFALLGYATSGLLDACTSYGTHLLWPFSDTRIAWSIIAIVDPVFSLILILALILGIRYRRALAARAGLSLCALYLAFGLWQHQAALQVARELAGQRGHEVERIMVKPTLGNLVLWRSVYESGGRFYVDAIRIGSGGKRVYAGGSTARFVLEQDRPQLAADPVVSNDIRRFERLADGYVAADSNRQSVLLDVRYSMLPTALKPMWGIDLAVAADSRHVGFEHYRDRPENYRQKFIAMLLGRDLPPAE